MEDQALEEQPDLDQLFLWLLLDQSRHLELVLLHVDFEATPVVETAGTGCAAAGATRYGCQTMAGAGNQGVENGLHHEVEHKG